jgi:putative SOS response-associated peptidase YedK
MCGRFTLSYKAIELQLSLGLTDVPADFQPRYNIAPSQPIAAVTDGKTKKLEYLKWGLVPGWAKDIGIGNKLINARSETIMEKPSYRNAFQRRRCLILADGFYEWKRFSQKGLPSQPYYFHIKDNQPFAFAGIWEIWQAPDGGELWSTAIITCAANSLVESVHERMPVILDFSTMWQWLDNLAVPQLTELMQPYSAEKMMVYPVSRDVNAAGTDHPGLVEPIVI